MKTFKPKSDTKEIKDILKKFKYKNLNEYYHKQFFEIFNINHPVEDYSTFYQGRTWVTHNGDNVNIGENRSFVSDLIKSLLEIGMHVYPMFGPYHYDVFEQKVVLCVNYECNSIYQFIQSVIPDNDKMGVYDFYRKDNDIYRFRIYVLNSNNIKKYEL